ncbi:uncharacterized protein LOC131319828 [Rhododendron vialii]|uniref:uncharacterized protein LOC131319828 n=1 Tax=Rhododendron vialii TaxID=182163 RepID=UPI00265D721E|nr:uncharacterized protein LOC131319828 [Rhododendron vialii]
MSKAVVCTFLAATAFTLFIVCFQSNKTIHRHHGPCGLGRRLGYKVPPPLFDPLVVKIERFVEEKGLNDWKTPTHWENLPVPKELDQEGVADFLSDEGTLNITLRLTYLFPSLDKNPEDGFVESRELEAWIMQQANDRLTFRAGKELASRDQDGDGAISFREYLPHFTNEDIERNGMEHGEAGWWKEQFRNADVDQNGLLNFTEFKDFLYPEDSSNEEIHKWLLREKIKPIDYDHDDKLNLEEFRNGAYDIYKNYVEFESGGANVPSPEEMFEALDVKKDKLLGVEELKPIFQYLSPGELSYAKYYASYLLHEADDDKDGKLTLHEMINHEYIFYSTVYDDTDFEDDDDDEDLEHEEL